MKRVLITGSGGPAGVNFVDSLRQADEQIYLVGADANRFHLCWPQTDAKYEIPKANSNEFIDKINELIEKESIGMVHPQPDIEVIVLSENREKINARTFLPARQTVKICQDKFMSSAYWNRDGLQTVKTIYVKNMNDLKEAERLFGYPYWLRASVGFSSRGSTLVERPETAKAWIDYWNSRGTDWKFIAQEYLPGKILAFQSIWKDGELITSQARERIEYLYHYLAPSGITNTPVIAKTVHRDDVNDIATKAVLSIDKKASGIFCVDLREDKNGNPVPTEINAGRFFTTSFFFTKAGINMPYYYVKLAYDEELPKLPKYNSIPAGTYWCRHIDCPGVLAKEADFNGFESI